MKYMFLWKPGPRANPPTEKLMTEMGQFIAEHFQNGTLLDTGGWDPASPFKVLRNSGGQFTVTDGPFAEAKEAIAGFAIMDFPTEEEAIKMGKRFLEIAGEGTSEMHPIPEENQGR